MILVDYSHLSSRNLYIAISQAKPKKHKETKKFITEEFIPFYKHLMLNSLRLMQKKYQKEFGEMILCLDVKGTNWRKEIYPGYKAHRAKSREESDIDFEEFHIEVNNLIEEIKEIFPYKVIGVKGAEADDIIATISKHYKEKILVISEDKDFKQLLTFPHVQIYAPIKQSFITMTPNELSKWLQEHILLGDSVDNIPNIKQKTEFSDAFINYLKSKDIHITKVYEFNKLQISKKLYEEFDVQKKYKSGANKGKPTGELDIFKTVNFGEKAVDDFVKNLNDRLKEHPLYEEHYERNKKLVLFSEIPEEIQNEIIKEFSKLELFYNKNKIFTYLAENNLIELARNVEDFYLDDTQFPVNENSSLDDWF